MKKERCRSNARGGLAGGTIRRFARSLATNECELPWGHAMKRYMTVGLSVLAGVALFEVALIPGVVIGAAAVLAPKYLQKLRRGLRPLFDPAAPQRAAPARALPDRRDAGVAPSALSGVAIKQAIAKTITFRMIGTTVDFTANYVVIGDLATAAGLSTIGLVAAPFFYLVHETAWNHFRPREAIAGRPALLIFPPGAKAGQGGLLSTGPWPRPSPSGASPR